MNSTELQSRISAPSILIRPIRLTDNSIEAEFVRRLSPQTKRFRFFGGIKELTPDILNTFCDVDFEQSAAFIAVTEEDGRETAIGVARYAHNTLDDVRQMSITVTDEGQNQGIGALLTQRLINFAKGYGIKQLYSVELADNTNMRQLAKELGMSDRPVSYNTSQVIYTLAL